MTIGERLDNTLADGLVALGCGLRRAWIIGGTVGHQLLSLRPAKVDADLRAYLAMQAAGEADRLADAEAERDSWEPGELSGLFPSGQPVDLPEEGVAQHPLYRELQEQRELWSPPGLDPCATLVYNTMPNWQAPQTSTPGSRSEAPDVVDSPDAVSPPGTASGSGQPVGVSASEPGADGNQSGLVRDLADELCDAVLDSYDRAPMVCGNHLDLPLRDEFLEGFDWECAAWTLLTYFNITRK